MHEPAILNEREIGGDFSSKFIPDNDPNGLTHEIETEALSAVGIVRLEKALITHSRHQDLEVTLESPVGTTVTLHKNQPGAGELSFQGMALFDFNGESPEGTWKVVVRDNATGEFGSLDEWVLQFSSPTNPQHFSYSDPGFSAAGSSRLVGSSDALGDRIYAVEYDEQNRVVSQDDGLDTNSLSRFGYSEMDDGGMKTVYTDRVGSSWTMEHDSMLRLIAAESPDGARATWTYNDQGLCVSTKDPLGRVNQFTYNSFGYMATAIDPSGETLNFAHGQSGLLRGVTDAMGRTTKLEYNGNGNLRRVTDAAGGETNKQYGANGELTQNLIEDGGGVEYTWVNGVLTSAKNMQNNSIKSDLSHDPAGRALKLVDAEGF